MSGRPSKWAHFERSPISVLFWKLRAGDWRGDAERRAIYRYIVKKKRALVRDGKSFDEVEALARELAPRGHILARCRQRLLLMAS